MRGFGATCAAQVWQIIRTRSGNGACRRRATSKGGRSGAAGSAGTVEMRRTRLTLPFLHRTVRARSARKNP